MGRNFYVVKKKPTIEDPIHIGKSSAGWKFSFHTVNEYNLKINTYPQWEHFLLEHCDVGGDCVILDEYDEEINVHDFLQLVEDKQKENNPDDFRTAKNIDGYRFTEGYFV